MWKLGKRGWQIFTAYIVIFYVFLIGLFVSTCNSEGGKYLYPDLLKCIHTKQDCKGFHTLSEYPTEGVNRVLRKDFVDYGYSYCRICVSDDTYEELMEISKRNKPDKPRPY